jgi:N-acetylglutamate synthase-like GNAT family acetyltransferase
LSSTLRIDRAVDISEREYDEIERFCEEGGLPRTEWMPGPILAIFTIRGQDGRLEATAKLERHGDRLFIEDLVVRPDLHGRGYGKKMVDATVEDARRREAVAVWAMARAVRFFKGLGFVESDDDDLRTEILRYCRRCKDYCKEFHPELLRLDLT